jgi:hypothetical protein
MKALIALTIAAIALVTAVNVARPVLNKQAQERSYAAHVEQSAKRDAAMKEACAAGKTGVVLYYKGTDCTAN